MTWLMWYNQLGDSSDCSSDEEPPDEDIRIVKDPVAHTDGFVFEESTSDIGTDDGPASDASSIDEKPRVFTTPDRPKASRKNTKRGDPRKCVRVEKIVTRSISRTIRRYTDDK